jgi:hypothetical protein
VIIDHGRAVAAGTPQELKQRAGLGPGRGRRLRERLPDAPVQSMPGWLQAFAHHQPITYMVDAVRALALGPDARAPLGHAAGFYGQDPPSLGLTSTETCR